MARTKEAEENLHGVHGEAGRTVEAGTVEGRLADMIEHADACSVAGYPLDAEECAVIVKALRDRARWMASDIRSGERPRKRR